MATIVEGKPSLPVTLAVEGVSFEYRGQQDYSVRGQPPWVRSVLLPSHRLGVLRVMLASAEALAKTMASPKAEERFTAMFAALATEALKSIVAKVPPFPLMLEDVLEVFSGKPLAESESVLAEAGELRLHTNILLTMLTFEYRDPYIENLVLPYHAAPDGALDANLIALVLRRLPERSLLVIEELETHKNPKMVIEFTKRIAKEAVSKQLTIVLTTHTDLIVLALAKMVERSELDHRDVTVYYLWKSKVNPWTTATRVGVNPDGTLEKLLEHQEAVTMLF